MNLDEAKNILELCRPGHPEDLEDPVIAEAFALCAKYPELREWFEQQQATDRAIAESIAKIEPPAELKAAILAGMRAHESNASKEPEPPIAGSSRTAWWRNPWIGIAALFAVMLTVIVLPENRPIETATLPDSHAEDHAPEILRFLAGEIDHLKMFSFDERDDDPKALQAYLTRTGAPSPQVIPASFQADKSIGCLVMDYQGTKLSMICFKGERVYHLTTADRASFPLELTAEPQTYELKEQAFKLWAEGEQVQILSVHGTEQDIPHII